MNHSTLRLLGIASAGIVLALAPAARAQSACDADTNDDGTVDSADLGALLSQWGPCKACGSDLNRDGQVDSSDLGALLSLWGESCNPLPWATVLEQSPDPAIVTNAALRDAIVATGFPWRVRDNETQIEMVLIPPGSFQMGCSVSNAHLCSGNEGPIHTVTLTNAFYIGRYEVTQAQWTARMGSNPSLWKNPSPQVPADQVPNRPVDTTSWDTIQNFLGGSVNGPQLRLPTEAEWEYAYRAGTTTAYHSLPGHPDGTNDDVLANDIAWWGACPWCGGNSGNQTYPVGWKAGNGFGLHDMAGNVYEWTNDWTGPYPSFPVVNPTGSDSGPARVLRGGSFGDARTNLRASKRMWAPPNHLSNRFGFRVVRELEAPSK